MTMPQSNPSDSAAPSDPARPWKLATGVLAVALVVCMVLLLQTSRGASPQLAASEAVPSAGHSEGASTNSQAAPNQAEVEALILAQARRQADDPMAKGSVDAPVVMVEYADYRCPFCSVFAEDTLPGLQPLIDDGTLRIEFRDLAIFGEDSVNAAAGARAAGEQGLFWEFQHALFVKLPNQGHPDVKDDLVMQIAQEVGVPDLAAFETAYRSAEVRAAVTADSEQAKQLGINGTPAFLVGSQYVSGAQPLEVFQELIAQEKEKLS